MKKREASKKAVRVSPRTTGQRLRREGQAVPRPIETGKPKIENLIVIGTSSGAFPALAVLLDSLPPDIPGAIVLIVHQTPGSPFKLAAALGRLAHLPVVTVIKDQALRQGAIYIPSPSQTLTFSRGRIQELTGKREVGARTTIDRMFASAADAYGDRVIGVILTGVLSDGTAGLRAVHDRGGLTIVQDPAEAQFGDMPRNARENLPVTFCLALRDIGPALDLLARRSKRLETAGAVTTQILTRRVEFLVRLKAQSEANAETCAFLDQELLALNRDLRSISRLLRSVPLKPRRS